MPHQFLGMSIFERLKQVQDIKTAVLRSTLDSFYQSVNRIKVVQEGQVNIDDLLVNRPGGIIRAKGHNAVTELGGTSLAVRPAVALSTLTCRRKQGGCQP